MRAFSPPTPSQASGYGGGGVVRNLVTKQVLEGSVKPGAESATIRIYAKVCVPEFPPSHAYPLFQEGSTRLLRSTCHPLSPDGVPYAFPPKPSRLVRRAARALNLPPPLPESYPDVLSPLPNAAHHKTNGGQILTSAMTGEVLVNNFEYCYLSPRLLIPPSSIGRKSPDAPRVKHRRSSIGASLRDGPLAYYLLAIELAVPLASAPPNGPHMLNMSLPRCLHNTLRLQLFPPRLARSLTSGYSSGASNASSDDEQWDIRTIPPLLAPSRPRAPSTTSAEGWADEEDGFSSSGGSASSLGSAGSRRSVGAPEVLRGTFPSAERLIIRWAQATPKANSPSTSTPVIRPSRSETRKKLAVGCVESKMTCIVGKVIDPGDGSPPSFPVTINFEATCIGVTHLGVETALAIDAVLDTFGSIAHWAHSDDPEPRESEFQVTGGAGIQGWAWSSSSTKPGGNDVGPPLHGNNLLPANPANRITSFMTPEAPSPSPTTKYAASKSTPALSIHSSNGVNGHGKHSASLLRAPLPGVQAQAVPDYSFESPTLRGPKDSANSDDEDEVISLPDGYFSSRRSSRRSSVNSTPIFADPASGFSGHHPSEPFIIQVEILPLLQNTPLAPPMRASFKLTTKLILSGSPLVPTHVALPVIRLPLAGSHVCSIIVRTEERGNDITVSAPENGNRSEVSVGRTTGLRCDVDIGRSMWSGGVSSHSGDIWGDDCLLIVVPSPRKSKPPLKPRGTTGENVTPTSPDETIMPNKDSHGHIPAPRFEDDDDLSTPTRQPLPSPSDRPAIPWVEVAISPVPPRSGNVEWTYVACVRAPWPSTAAEYTSPAVYKSSRPPERVASSFDLGFARAGVGQDRRQNMDTRITASSVDGRPAVCEMFSGERAWTTEAIVNPVWDDLANWARLKAPSGTLSGMIIEILYEAKSGDLADPSSMANLNIPLPLFNSPVSRYTVTVDDLADYNVRPRQHSFAVCTKSPPHFMQYNVAAYFAPDLSLDIFPIKRTSRLHITVPMVAFTASSLLLSFMLLKLGRDIHDLRLRVDSLQLPSLEPTRPQIQPSTTTVTEMVTTVPTPIRNRFLISELSEDLDSFFPSLPFDDSVDDLPASLWVTPTITAIATSEAKSPSISLSSSFPLALSSSRLGALIMQPFRIPWLDILRHTPAILFWKAWGILIMILEFPAPNRPLAT